MKYILCLETSGTNCSVAISQDDNLVTLKEINTGGFSHSENLHLFIQELLTEKQLNGTDFQAIAVSSGPGSYTGLRIGVASAKGLCYAWDVPLIAIPTLDILARSVTTQNAKIVPMLDARRMEVYTCIFNASYEQLSPTQPKILNENSFETILNEGEVIFLGDGSDKFQQICHHPNAKFLPKQFPSAMKMPHLAFEYFQQKKWEDIAYFNPIYLKSGV